MTGRSDTRRRSFGVMIGLRPIVLCLLMCLCSAPAWAQDDYEALLSRLASAQSQTEAEGLSQQIWQHWLTAPDAAAQEVLDAAMIRRQARDYLGAITQLNRLVETYPDYAEGWNQRATLHYLRGDYEKSLSDVAEVLAREPRHFGALAGRSVILFNQGKRALAQLAVLEALRHHPFLNERAILGINKFKDI